MSEICIFKRLKANLTFKFVYVIDHFLTKQLCDCCSLNPNQKQRNKFVVFNLKVKCSVFKTE